MSRVANADEFLRRFRSIQADYDEKFGPLIGKLRAKYVGEPEQDLVDNSLEAHSRAYIINGILEALNWRLNKQREDDLPDLIPESPVASTTTNTIRFLDYLGLERQTNRPLLIVEAKRPNAEFLRSLRPATSYSEVVSKGLSGQHLSGEWNKWLEDLGDYTRSIHSRTNEAPKRVVITNGDWIVIFLDPADAFLDSGNRNANLIVAMKDASDVERRFNDVFLSLEYQNVLADAPPLLPGEVAFYLDPDRLDYAMHGLRLRYIDQRGIYQHSPVIKVAPIIFVASRYGGWLRIEAPPREYDVPHEARRLRQHLADIEAAAHNLLEEVRHSTNISLQLSDLPKHYDDKSAFDTLHAVAEHKSNDYLIVTGNKTHYFIDTPRLSECKFHDWASCNTAGVAPRHGPILFRSVSPRSFFVSTEPNHCAHRDVISSKAMQITESNRPRCGPRSGRNGQAFCEIWRFEEYLCCRTCVFEDVCTKSLVFQLPCDIRK